MKCHDCTTDIIAEQQGEYFKRCPSCYGTYKQKIAKLFLVPAMVSFVTSAFNLWKLFGLVYLEQWQRETFFMRGLSFMFLGAIWCLWAWRMAFTEVVHWRYAKREHAWFAVVLLLMLLVGVLMAIFPAIS